MKVEKVTVEQVRSGDTLSLYADGTNSFVVKSIRDGLRSGLGLRTTAGVYAKFPWGYPLYRVTDPENGV